MNFLRRTGKIHIEGYKADKKKVQALPGKIRKKIRQILLRLRQGKSNCSRKGQKSDYWKRIRRDGEKGFAAVAETQGHF